MEIDKILFQARNYYHLGFYDASTFVIHFVYNYLFILRHKKPRKHKSNSQINF